MVSLVSLPKIPLRAGLLSIGCCLAVSIGAVSAQERAGDAGEVIDSPLSDARSAYSDLELEKAEALARAFLEASSSTDETDETVRTLRAEAWDIVAQCRFHAGDKQGQLAAIEAAIRQDPNYLPDTRLAGPKFAELYAGEREKLTGLIEMSCRPVPCEFATIAGRFLSIDTTDRAEPAPIRVVAGTVKMSFGARNFAEARFDALEVEPGKVTSVEVELEQVARDLVLTVTPSSALATLVGENREDSQGRRGEVLDAARAQESRARVVVPSLEPGRYVLTLEAPCRRRIEQSVQITLDELDPGPLDLGAFVMDEASATIELVWHRREGVLAVDGRPVQAGTLELCPGTHDLSLEVGGRRVWFERVDLAPEENRRLVASPRPTLALIGSTETIVAEIDKKQWNFSEVSDDAAETLMKVLGAALAPMESDLPSFPKVLRFDRERLAAAVGASIPTADLLLATVEGAGRLARSRTLVVLDVRRGLLEAARWPRQRAEQAREIARFFAAYDADYWAYWGFDLVGRNDPYPVVARVAASGPAGTAGMAAGDLIKAIDGRTVGDIFDARRRLSETAPGRTAKVVVITGAAERTLEVTPQANVAAPLPATLLDGLVLPRLAHAGLRRIAGQGEQRLAGAVHSGLLLAALGREEEAAEALGVAAVDRAIDPSGYARGTVAWVLESILRRLGEEAWAEEVRARAAEIDEVRLGGPDGPRLDFTPIAP